MAIQLIAIWLLCSGPMPQCIADFNKFQSACELNGVEKERLPVSEERVSLRVRCRDAESARKLLEAIGD